ncbi:enoyl-CoA hydratase-related protein [Arenicella sp. 4NH20-0111]
MTGFLLIGLTMKKFEAIDLDLNNHIATITLNRPDAANGLNLQMASELADAARLIEKDSSLKVAVLTGAGKFFCAGGDVKSMYDAHENPGAAVRLIADQLHAALAIFSNMEIPLICAVNGTAAGAGFSMAVSADMVIASESAKFTMAYSNIGLSPDGSASYYLPRLIGLRKTQELMFTNTVLSAQQAKEWGLVNQVVSGEEFASAIESLTTTFINGSRSSNAAIKHLLTSGDKNSLEEQMALEARTIELCANAADGREGVNSFIEKRRPVFK